jgi:hypothetical protein
MKTLKIFTLLFVVSTTAFAQLKIDHLGRTRVGADFTTTFDDDGQVTMALFGNQSNGGGAKLAFGNYRNASNWGMNCFVGELNDGGNYDSDILHLHGKNGIFLTGNGSATSFITKFHTPVTNPYYDVETGSVVAYSVYTWSDSRLKTNMKTITGSLDKIKRLRGVTYDMLTTKEESELAELNRVVGKDAKEKDELEKRKKSLKHKIDVKSKNCIGFSAQEIEAVFPQAVEKDNSGMLAVNYTEIIPVLLEGIKEQQTVIDTQKAQIDNLLKEIVAIKK